MKLTLKQKRFADEYIISGNVYKSAVSAGYSDNYAKGNAAKLFENVRVKEYIAEKLAKMDDKKVAKANEVMEYLTSVLRGETNSEIVVVEGQGEGVSEARKIMKAPDERERLKAAELLGKRYGIFSEKVNIDGALPIIIAGEDNLEE